MTPPLPGVSIDLARGVVRVRCGAPLLADEVSRSSMLGRIFTCPHVHRVDIGAAAQAVEVHLDLTAVSADVGLADLCRAVRDGRRVALPLDAAARLPLSLRRVGGRLTTWRVTMAGADRLRFSHPRLRRDRVLARRVERFALAVPGVLDARPTTWRGSLVVRYDPARLDAGRLLAGLQNEVDRQASAPASSAWEMAGTTATLGVAATADLAVTALAPLSAVLLVGTNIRTLGAAAAELRRGRVGMPTVATAIVFGTLATGQFLASGLMAWTFDFWRRRHRRDIDVERRLLIEDALQAVPDVGVGPTEPPMGPVVEAGSAPVSSIDAGEVVPLDGRIIAGGGVIDDRAVTGVSGGRLVGVGDVVAAGSVVLGGRLSMTAERVASASRLAAIGRMLEEATTWRPGRMAPTIRGEEFGEQFAVPTLATAGLGLLAGDVGTAVAVMRPDYAHAEAITVSFEDLDAVARGLVAGCVVSSPRGLDGLAVADTLVILDHPALRRRRLRVCRVVSAPAENGAGGAGATDEAIRWAASLATHLADDRREALADLAASRGCVLLDVVPDAFGDEQGLRITCRQGDREIVVHEADPLSADAVRPLVLTVSGRPVATFEFVESTARRAAAGLGRLRDRGLRVLLAAAGADAAPDIAALAEELRCDALIVPDEQLLAEQIEALASAGRRIACVAAGGLPAGCAEAVSVRIHVGDVTAAAGADIVVLSGDVGRIADLMDAAEQRRRSMGRSRQLTILPNVMCVAGAFLLGFTSLVVVVVSNLSTLVTYRGASRKLEADRRRTWLRTRPLTRVRLP